MTSDPQDLHFARRLAPEVLQYTSEQFDLGEDLRHLDGVRRVGAPEATIFYSARILEVLTADALQAAGLPASANVLSNLVVLEQFNLISPTTRYWAHSLRRSGNSVRHIRERVRAEDAEPALVIADRLLKWFFCDLRAGRQLPAITVDRGPIWQDACPELHAVIESFDDARFDPAATAHQLEENRHGVLLRTPALPAVLADILLERGERDAAKVVLERALARFPGDLRLLQLMGLLCSRSLDFKQALAYLEPLYDKYTDDEETAGILGGIYKRLWQFEEANTDWLGKSYRAYRRGWERSKYSNAYPGINAATTALWLGRPSESRETAGKVRDILRSRVEAVHARPDLVLDYWDQVSLAEAELLVGNVSVARTTYGEAFERHKLLRDNVEVSKGQLAEILPRLGLSVDPDEFLARLSPKSRLPTLILGVSGHRSLPGDQRLLEQVQAALKHVVQVRYGKRKPALVLLSALAEGADRLLAKLVLSPSFGGALHAVIPLEVNEYRLDFETEDSVAEFESLLNHAESIIYPPSAQRASSARESRSVKKAGSPQSGRDAAYEWRGRYIVDQCDVLVAVWNGMTSEALGGTAEIVSYARKVQKPLLWVRSFPPFEWTAEGVA
jgi:tetratricopeptide (TPR) repeat protein